MTHSYFRDYENLRFSDDPVVYDGEEVTSCTPDLSEPDSESDSWSAAAEHQEILEAVIDQDVPFAPYAERLLEALEEKGYR